MSEFERRFMRQGKRERAACGQVDKCGDNLSGPMRSALQWLAKGNEFEVSLIDGFGYAAEMPRRSTLQALANRGLVEVEKTLGGFSVHLTDAGRKAAA